MRIIATALLALGILALPVTTADAHRRHYQHWHHHYGPSVMVAPGFFGLYVGPSYGYHRQYYRDPYWHGRYYGEHRYWHRPYWRERYYDPWDD